MSQSNYKLIVLTGGPGAGKTAVMEAARLIFGAKLVLLPEAASVVYSGGFPRRPSVAGIQAAQRAIVHVQRELEQLVFCEEPSTIAICDRGIMDSAAYWPTGPEDFMNAVGFTREEIFARYHAVIHLRTPSAGGGYNYSNPMRIETPEEARRLDEKIHQVWQGHPNLHIVEATEEFTDKINHVTTLIRSLLTSPARADGSAGAYLQ